MALRILCFLCFLAFSHAGVLPFLDPRIVNGEDATVGEFPYQISLQEKDTSSHFCGGSILNDNYVITAAHCVTYRTANELKVVAGTVDLTHPKSQHNVDKIIIHKEYNGSNYFINDIALLKVQPPFVPSATVGHVPLPPKRYAVKANDVAVVSGWGTLWSGGPIPTMLQRANILIGDQAYCQYKYNHSLGFNIYPTHLCAYEPSALRGACKGDSGGPLTVGGKLVGLVSWAYPAGCASTYPFVYTRVVSYLDWITNNVD